MLDLISAIAVTALCGAVLVAATTRRLPRDENLLIAGFVVHVAASFAQVLITKYVYGGGDLFAYFFHGSRLAELVWTDPITYLPKVVHLFLGGAPTLPVNIHGEGGSTGSMAAAAALSLVVTGGSLYGSCILLGSMAYSGQVALFATFRELFDEKYRLRLAAACLFIPSVVFWSSGILKETIALCGLGWLTFWTYRAFICRRWGSAILAGLAGFLVSLVKSYALFPFVVAFAAWLYWWKSKGRSGNPLRKPAYFFAALVTAMFMIAALGQLFPRYAVPNLTEETARIQELYYRQDSGSGIQYSSREEVSSETQIFLAPVGLVTSLFRPFIFEFHNATAFVNALEMLVLTWILIAGLNRRGTRRTFELIGSSPVLVFLLVYIVIFGTAVGLAAPNLGSLSRYRILMMPFYGVLLAAILPLGRR